MGAYFGYRVMDVLGRIVLPAAFLGEAKEVWAIIAPDQAPFRSVEIVKADYSGKIRGVPSDYFPRLRVDEKNRVTIPKEMRVWLIGLTPRPVRLLMGMVHENAIVLDTLPNPETIADEDAEVAEGIAIEEKLRAAGFSDAELIAYAEYAAAQRGNLPDSDAE